MTDSGREELERQLAAADRESDALALQMDTIRHTVGSEVDRTWPSAWKSPETVDAKVRARLAGHREYQALRVRQRELDGLRRSLTTQPDGLGARSRLPASRLSTICSARSSWWSVLCSRRRVPGTRRCSWSTRSTGRTTSSRPSSWRCSPTSR